MSMFRDGWAYPNGNTSMGGEPIEGDSIHDYFHKSVGEHISKTITLAADATTASVNIFQLTGTVEVVQIKGFVTAVTTMADCDAASLDWVARGEAQARRYIRAYKAADGQPDSAYRRCPVGDVHDDQLGQ